jgi:SPP1 gp7 family putative phage head morphogenesis protein
MHINEAARPGQFDNPTITQRVHAFEAWLHAQMLAIILEVSELNNLRRRIDRHWQNRFLRAAYIRGIMSAESDLKRLDKLLFSIDDIDIAIQTGVHAEMLGLMYARAYEGLRGITETLSSQMSQIFSQSLIEGVSIAAIVSRLVAQISKVSKIQAMALSRTEVIRTYNEAKLRVFEDNKIPLVSTDVEFSIQDSKACKICKKLDGKRFTIDEAKGVIPVHVNCRCDWKVATDEVKDAA